MKQSKKIHIGIFSMPRRLFVALCVVIVAMPTLFYLYNYSFLSPRNYATEVAKPLEEALVKAGAIKKCSEGDNGRTIDNREPWYKSYFEMNAPRGEAVEAIRQIADENGYNLLYENGEPITDLSVRERLFDTSTKASPYKDLDTGAVELKVGVENSGTLQLSRYVCRTPNDVEIKNDTAHSAVIISVNLPSFRQ